MMKRVLLFSFSLLFTSGMLMPVDTTSKEEAGNQESPIISLLDSTRLIRLLIHNDTMTGIFDNHDPEQLESLINNVSPAQLAFEAEVIGTTIPYTLVYCFDSEHRDQVVELSLEKIARTHEEHVKVVVVDIEKLFILEQLLTIEKFPALLVIKEGQEIARSEGKALNQKVLATILEQQAIVS